MGRTVLLKRKRSNTASSSLPPSCALGHSLEAETQRSKGTLDREPSPFSNTRSLRRRSKVFRIALDALKISSRKQRWASGSLLVVTLLYLSSLRPCTLIGPKSSSGV